MCNLMSYKQDMFSWLISKKEFWLGKGGGMFLLTGTFQMHLTEWDRNTVMMNWENGHAVMLCRLLHFSLFKQNSGSSQKYHEERAFEKNNSSQNAIHLDPSWFQKSIPLEKGTTRNSHPGWKHYSIRPVLNEESYFGIHSIFSFRGSCSRCCRDKKRYCQWTHILNCSNWDPVNGLVATESVLLLKLSSCGSGLVTWMGNHWESHEITEYFKAKKKPL